MALLADLAQVFLGETPRMIATLQEAVRQRNTEKIERAAHSLKGSVSTFAAKDAIDAAYKLEMIGREGRMDAAESAAESLAHEVVRLRAALEELIVSLEKAPGVILQ